MSLVALECVKERLQKVQIVAPPTMHVGVKSLQEDCAWLVSEVERLRGLLADLKVDPDPPIVPAPAVA